MNKIQKETFDIKKLRQKFSETHDMLLKAAKEQRYMDASKFRDEKIRLRELGKKLFDYDILKETGGNEL